MASYDDFAWFYNRYWNEDFHGLAFPILERIWLPYVPQGARILDVCCGTGYLAKLLTLSAVVIVVETTNAKLRLFRVPDLLSAAFVLATLALLFTFLFQ